jgi:benzoate transport
VNIDPRETIAQSPMSVLQILVVVLTVGLNALDGFDVMSISFASPGIATEWGIDRAALGIVLSMELIGMMFGSIFLGGLADRIGRRPTIIGCVIMMAAGMYLASTVTSIGELCVWRVLTGLGIGGMLAAINALVAEFSNARRRHLCVSIMAIGYPVGAVAGGMVVARLLRTHDWRAIFHFGALLSAAFIPLVLFLVPESVHWLTRKQPKAALERINRALARMGHAAVAALPVISTAVRKRSQGDLFRPGLLRITLIVTLAYSFHMLPFYFILKWVPKIVVDMGFAPAAAAGVLVWTNVGGALGGLALGLLTLRFGVKPLTIAVLLLTTVMVTLFGRTAPDLHKLALICASAGFCINAAIVGMYAIFAQAFPTHVRASGTGFAIGVARGGSVASPVIAGFLFKAGYSLPSVALTMALGALVAAGVLALLKLRPEEPGADSA